MRILASVRRVRDIQPIVGADFIVRTQVDGWQCVTKKGEFQVDDLGVYFEIDSFQSNTTAFLHSIIGDEFGLQRRAWYHFQSLPIKQFLHLLLLFYF